MRFVDDATPKIDTTMMMGASDAKASRAVDDIDAVVVDMLGAPAALE